MEMRPAGKRETRKLERRAAIVAVARRAFLDEGYAATSMSSLSQTLGGSKATLWSYFRSKEELFAAVIEDVTHAFRERLAGELRAVGDPRMTLVAFCRGFMNKAAVPDALATWRLVVSESGRSPEVGRIFYERAASHIHRALAGYIGSQIDAGRLRAEDPVRMAQLLMGMCGTQQTRSLFGLEMEDRDTAAERFTDYFLRLFAVENPTFKG
jgi:AcrR family transcriptional regulator